MPRPLRVSAGLAGLRYGGGSLLPALAFFELLLGVILIDSWLKWLPVRAWLPNRSLAASIAIVVASLLSPAPGDAVRARHRQVQASLREQGY